MVLWFGLFVRWYRADSGPIGRCISHTRLKYCDEYVCPSVRLHILKKQACSSQCFAKTYLLIGQVRELETELETEQHRHVDAQKAVRKQDRRLQEVILQLDEGQKSQDRLKDMIDKLQLKNKQYKRQVEEAVRN